ncbi:hypothetical protein QWJ34_12215 [Saccharibacillus sp. CPCC 101409]|uniref:hypothetical protein n=1 Tax=Saccharibacillus sp. CPCC 101409 TaxID=3058041 RepID=UPI002673F102|nr:hypothetical protein [Saccharibacillus sp. CPCC 101409]MDO3410527.1 hypothetical protein [Saccharibacillus sp. CPCC 101409]
MGIMQKDIYVRTDSSDLWWGVYELGSYAVWEDIRIYDNQDEEAERIGYFCLCTRQYLLSAIEELGDDPDEREHVEEMQSCLDEGVLHVHYSYDHPAEGKPDELTHDNLPVDERGVRPHYLELWVPRADAIDLEMIEECVRFFCEKFLNVRADAVRHLSPMGKEEALSEYLEHQPIPGRQIQFAESLVDEMRHATSKSREDVLRILGNSARI